MEVKRDDSCGSDSDEERELIVGDSSNTDVAHPQSVIIQRNYSSPQSTDIQRSEAEERGLLLKDSSNTNSPHPQSVIVQGNGSSSQISPLQRTGLANLTVHPFNGDGSDPSESFPSLVPLNESDLAPISSDSFFNALKEEVGPTDSARIGKKCYEAVDFLRARRVLDRYVLNEDEAAVICAIPFLLEKDFSFKSIVESCEEKPPRKFMVMILTALRKLPRYRGFLFFEQELHEVPPKREPGSIIRFPFYVASKYMILQNEGKIAKSYTEVFKVDNGWGYDISNFVLTEDENGNYGKNAFTASIPFFTFLVPT